MNKKDSTKFILKRLFSFYIKKHYSKLFFAIFCMVLVSAATAINAWLMQPVLDDIFIKKNGANKTLSLLVYIKINIILRSCEYFLFINLIDIYQINYLITLNAVSLLFTLIKYFILRGMTLNN